MIQKTKNLVALFSCFLLMCICFYGCSKKTASVNSNVNSITWLEEKYPGISFNKRYVEDIPVVDVFNNNKQSKPTVFIVHGYGENKYNHVELASKFAQQGYYAVIFDAYGHGERTGGTLKSFPEVMAMYPYDIEKVVNSLKDNPQADLNRLGMMGISMGACAIYKYCTFAKVRPKAITPFIGTPYYEQLMNSELSRIAYDATSGKTTSNLTQQQLNKILADSSPYKDYQKLSGIAILMQNGGTDDLITSQGVNMLYHDLTGLGSENVELIIYPNLWHEINDTGWDNAFNFLKQHLK